MTGKTPTPAHVGTSIGHAHAVEDDTLARLRKRLEHMLADGRITDHEAGNVLAATDAVARQAAITAIQRRHATDRIREALRSGAVSEIAAREAYERIADAPDATALRRVVREYTGAAHHRDGTRGTDGQM